MPQAIPFIIGAVGAYAGTAALTIAVVQIASALAIGFYQANKAKKKARDAYNRSLQDRVFTVRSGAGAREYVFGTVRKSGLLIYADSIGLNKTGFDSIIAIANNTCQATAYYIGDEYISLAQFPGTKYGHREIHDVFEQYTVTGPTAVISLGQTPVPGTTTINGTFVRGGERGNINATYGPGNQITVTGLPDGADVLISLYYKVYSGDKLRVQFKTGLANQSSTSWGDFTSPLWDDGTHRLRGVAHMRTLMIWDDNIYTNGAPQTGVVAQGGPVDGYPIYDPRTGTNPTYTSNPAILWGYWRTLPRDLGGMGVPTDWIDWQNVAIAANICDELITVRSIYEGEGFEQIKRYECHTVLSTDATASENEQIILGAMAGRKVFTAGKFRVVAGAFRPAAITLTDSDVVGTKPITVITADPSIVPPNLITARFSDATKNWIEGDPVVVKNDSYIALEGEQPLDVALPATTDPRQANYLMGVELETQRPSFAITMGVGGVGENLAIFDTVQLNLTNRSAYAGRTFEILGHVDNWDGTFDLTLAELKTTTFALDPDTFTPAAPIPVPDLSYLWNIPALTGFTVDPQTPVLLPDGTSLTRIELSWDPPPGDYIQQGGHIEIRYRRAGSEWISGGEVPGDATSTTITAAIFDSDAYQFQARAVSAIGAAGPWADAWEQIVGTPIPSAAGIRLSATSFVFHVPAGPSGVIEPAVITFTLNRAGVTQPALWSTSPAVTLGGSGDVRTLAYAAMTATAVQVSVQVEEDGKIYIDSLTIIKLFDGAAGPDYIPDDTPPPTPTNFTVTAALLHFILEWDEPTYTEGHGPASTQVYGVKIPAGGPQPVFTDAAPIGGTTASILSHQVGTGETWAFWIKHKSKDGALSATPAGGLNGIQATTGKIGDADLGPLIIEAADLASGAVTADKIAAGIIDTTKFAAGIEPIPNVATLPTTRLTAAVFLTSDQHLYTWNGTAYVLPAAGVTTIPANTITSTMIQDGAISTPKLAANSVTANAIAAGTITAGKLAANSVEATNLAANSIIAGKIAANAVNAQAIAAGAITTSKLLVSGQGAALNDDPGCADQTAWLPYRGGAQGTVQAGVSSSIAPGGLVLRFTGVSNIESRAFPIVQGKRYRISVWARKVSGTGALYVELLQYPAAGTPGSYVAFNIGLEAVALTPSFVRYVGYANYVSDATTATLYVAANWAGTGVTDLADFRCEEVIPGELIVDGTITASKIAANAIAVGSAAIQNAAITNAMLGNAIIDSAKIVDGAIVTAKIGAAAITNAHISDATITGAKIANASIASAHIADAAITSAKIGSLQVDSAKIADLTIGTAKIVNNAVSGSGSISQGAPITIGAGTSILSLGYSSMGGALLIQCRVSFQNLGLSPQIADVQLRVDGNLVDSDTIGIGAGGQERFVGIALSIVSAGSHTFSLSATSSNVQAINGLITLIEFKK